MRRRYGCNEAASAAHEEIKLARASAVAKYVYTLAKSEGDMRALGLVKQLSAARMRKAGRRWWRRGPRRATRKWLPSPGATPTSPQAP